MKLFVTILGVLLGCSSFSLAQDGGPSGRGSITGDPAASSANPRAAPTGTTTGSNPSGSGTSTSGGKDENNDQGRDKMPDSDMSVRPYDQQPHKPK